MNQEMNDQVMEKLHQIIPELRKMIEIRIREEKKRQCEEIISQKREELKQQYKVRLEQQIKGIYHSINQKYTYKKQEIEQLQRQLKSRQQYTLTSEEQEECINSTVQQIIEDPSMKQQVRGKLQVKTEHRIKQILSREMEETIQNAKIQMMRKIKSQRDSWEMERVQFWRTQSDLELEQLRERYNELQLKKDLVEETFNTKKLEKAHLKQTYENYQIRNQQIQDLRKQLKHLKTELTV